MHEQNHSFQGFHIIMSLRVAIFHTTLPQPGRKLSGVESTVHRLANALVKHGDTTVTLFSCDPKPVDAKYEHVELFPGKIRGAFSRFIGLPLALNFVDFSDFDIVHLHGDDWFFVRRGLASVRSMHGSALREAQKATTLKRKTVQHLIYFFERLAVKLATVTVVAAEDTKEIYGVTSISDIYGVDGSLFRKQAKYPTPLIFFVGTWGGRKRGEMAFNTFVQQILPAFPEAKLYMATDFAPEHPAVINGGFPSNEEFAEWLGKAWIFLYPSSYEGFGIPYIEALASGTAVVATRNDGAEHVLQGCRYGIITADDDFGAAALALLRDDRMREEFQERGLVRAGNYSWANVAQTHLVIYRNAISKFKK